MKRLTIGMCVLAMLMLVSGVASAIPIGDPFVANSWGQTWQESGYGPFDTMVLRMISPLPDAFEMPSITPYSGGFPNAPWNWTETYNAGTNVVWSGPDTSNTGLFNLMFTGPITNPLQLDLLEFNNGVAVASWRYTYNGSGGSYGSIAGWSWFQNGNLENEVIPAPPSPDNPVPEPASMSILGLGVMGLVVRSWRKRAV